MTVAYWCVVIACLLPMVAIGYAKFFASDAKPSEYDNNSPRDYLDKLEGKRKRAVWAEKNQYETLPLFIAVVLISHSIGTSQATMDLLAVSFVLLRLIYIAFYIYDKAAFRTLSWIGAMACCLAMVMVA